MIHWHPKNQRGFTWYQSDNTAVKGFAFDANGNFLQKQELAAFFQSSNVEQFQKHLREANGHFAVVRIDGSQAWAATDRLRSFPLFYLRSGSDFHISDDANFLAHKLPQPKLNSLRCRLFESSGYVAGPYTLLEDIQQLQTGGMLQIENGQDVQKFYHHYHTAQLSNNSYATLQQELVDILETVQTRFINSLQGRPVALSLSGGFDSRLIAAMLKKANYSNVFCYTFGREDNPEMPYAEKISRQLGFKWQRVVYSRDMIAGFMEDGHFHDYFPFAANLTSMFFMESYFALRLFKDQLPAETIFLAGHSGDFLGGSQLLKNGGIQQDATNNQIARALLQIKYGLLPLDREAKKECLGQLNTTIQTYRDEIPRAPAYTLFENWDLKEKLARFIFNASAVYNFFGFEHRHPLMDNGLMDFFQNVPYAYKLNKKLYDDVLRNEYFRPLQIDFRHELQPRPLTYSLQQIKNRIRPLLPDSLKYRFSLRNDVNNYREITGHFIRELEQDGIKVRYSGKNFNAIIVQWYVAQLKKLFAQTH